jgi:uncharacterized membrane protein
MLAPSAADPVTSSSSSPASPALVANGRARRRKARTTGSGAGLFSQTVSGSAAPRSSTVPGGQTDATPVAGALQAPAPAGRLLALDSLRGWIMIVMAIDHASLLMAKTHSGEFWGTALPEYPDAWWLLTRWVTHLCAPGFFFLMGAGIALLAEARRAQGWGEGRVSRFLVTRGLLLIVLQHLLENPAWLLGELSSAPGAMTLRGGGVPGGGDQVLLHFGVLWALGAAMVVWGLLLRLPSLAVATISLSVLAATQLLTPGPEHEETLFSPAIRLLLVPGQSGVWQVFYPLLPWLGVAGLGLLAGRGLRRDPAVALRRLGVAGAAALALFFGLRAFGVGDFHPVGAGLLGWLELTKYPPSLAFLAVTLGINLLLLRVLSSAPASKKGHPSLVFGRSALFFYLAHLYLFGALGFAFPHGASLPTLYAVWLVGLAALYPLCRRWARFKDTKPAESLWRLF